MNDKDTVVDAYAARRDAVMRGLASFCECTPDFDMSAGLRRSAAEHILGMVDLAAAPSTSVREEQQFINGMIEAATICGTLAETTYDAADAFAAACGCEAAIHAHVMKLKLAALKPSTDKGDVG